MLKRVLQPVVSAGWAMRHPVLAAKHLALNSTFAGSPMSLDQLASRLSEGSTSISGRRVTSESLLRMTAAMRAVRLIADTAGLLPLRLMERTNDIPRAAVEHPLYRRLHRRPSKYQTSAPFIGQLVTSMALWNQAYIRADGFGTRRSLTALSPMAAQPEVYNDGMDLRWRVQQGSKQVTLELGDIIPIDGFRMPGAIEGMAVAGMHREAFSLAMSAEEFGSRFFASGGRPSGVLTTEMVLKKDQREQLRESYKNLLHSRGIDDMGDIHVLEGGVKYQAISTPANDSQFLETRKYAVHEIGRIFGVPPHMLGELDRATYANAEQNNQEFLTYTLMPYLNLIEEAINTYLIPENEQGRYFAKFSVEGLLRSDAAARAAFYQQGRVGGWITANEIRRLEDLPRVEGADDLHAQMNLAPIDMLRGIHDPESD